MNAKPIPSNFSDCSFRLRLGYQTDIYVRVILHYEFGDGGARTRIDSRHKATMYEANVHLFAM